MSLVLLVRKSRGIQVLVKNLKAGGRAVHETKPQALLESENPRLPIARRVDDEHPLGLPGCRDRAKGEDEEGRQKVGQLRDRGGAATTGSFAFVIRFS